MAKNKKENSEVTQSTTTEGKKPFDKAKWRKMKYGHREKVDKWKNRWAVHMLCMKHELLNSELSKTTNYCFSMLCAFSFFRKDEKVKRHYFKMLKKEESKKVAAGSSNLEPLGEKGKIKKEDPVTARKMAAAFEARKKEAERKQKKVKKLPEIT